MVDKKLVKSAGEHWACAVLSRFGWSVALTRDGVERTDVLAVRPETGDMIALQVKTASPAKDQRFFLGAKGCLPEIASNEWYVLVALDADRAAAPRTYVVPRNHVAAATFLRHQEWATNPSVPPGTRNTPLSSARIDEWIFARYEDRWDLLDQPTTKAPVMLPPAFRRWATMERVGLRDDHPWQSRLPRWDSGTSPEWPDWATSSAASPAASSRGRTPVL